VEIGRATTAITVVQIAAPPIAEAKNSTKLAITLTPVLVSPNEHASRQAQRQKTQKQHHYTTSQSEMFVRPGRSRPCEYDNCREDELYSHQRDCH
jgi:hypothetical protein